MKIIARDIPPRAAWALEQAGVHPLLARLYAARGVRTKDELDDGLGRLLPPSGLKGIDTAARLLADAMAAAQAAHHRGRLRLRRRHRLRRGRARPAPAGRPATWTTWCPTA